MKKPIKKLKDIRWVWFDLDDTLWDFSSNSRKLLDKLYHERGFNRWFASEEEWVERYETYNKQLWADYAAARITRDFLLSDRFRKPLADAGHPDADAEGRFLDGHYLDRLGQMDGLVDGARETLVRLRELGYKIGVLSNGFTRVQHSKVAVSGLTGLIDLMVLSDDIGITKPDRRLFAYAEQKAQARAEECLMVGDNPVTDVGGALAAGWKAIFFRRDNTNSTPDGAFEATKLSQIIYFL